MEELKKVIWRSRKELKDDLDFFGYDEVVAIGYNNNKRFEIIYQPKDEVSEDQINGAKELLKDYYKEYNSEIKTLEKGYKVILYLSKAKDGAFSEMDIDLKSLDDAISQQGAMIGNVIGWLNKISREWDNLTDAEAPESAEINISLSDISPFKKLSEAQLRNMNTVEKFWNNLPRFMYFKEELEVFEKEYQEIMGRLKESGRKSMIKLLDKTINEIEKMDKDELAANEAKLLTELGKKIKSKIKSARIEIAADLEKANNMNGFISGLKQIKSELEKK